MSHAWGRHNVKRRILPVTFNRGHEVLALAAGVAATQVLIHTLTDLLA